MSDRSAGRICTGLALAVTMIAAEASGQDTDPQPYGNMPVGLNSSESEHWIVRTAADK